MASIFRNERPIYVGIDIGTSKTSVLVGQTSAEGQMRVIGVGVVPSKGMRKGGVASLDDLTRTVSAAKDKAERTSGYEITAALVSVSGQQVASVNSRGMAGVSGRTIGEEDVERVLEAARSIAVPHNCQIIHVIPRSYVVDGQDGIHSPIGMHGYRLEVEAHVATSATTALRNLQDCIEKCAIGVDGWVLASLAAGEVVLTETEREMGAVVCDVGGGTCDIAVYIEGSVWHTAVIPVGGNHITNDLAQGLHVAFDVAEGVKLRHGCARAASIEGEEAIAIKAFGSDSAEKIERSKLAAIIEPRVEETFSLVRQEIKRSGYEALLPAGVVLTGGTSQLPGIREVAGDVLNLPVRLGRPQDLRGLVDKLRSPAYSASVGMLRWAQMVVEEKRGESGAYGLVREGFDIRRAVNDLLWRLLPG